MANRSRSMLISGGYKIENKFVMPLVTNLHPATTVLTPIVKKAFEVASTCDPVLKYLFPLSSIVVAYKKLPSLKFLICRNDQNSLVAPPQPFNNFGYKDTGCKCLLCLASTFGRYAVSPAMPGYKLKLPETISCKSGPGVVYHIVCHSGKEQCKNAHYVGRLFTNNNHKFPMRLRWSTHKSHFRTGFNGCKMTDHLLKFHKGENPQTFLKVTILQQANTLEETLNLEIKWTRRLFAYTPTGLNEREEDIRES